MKTILSILLGVAFAIALTSDVRSQANLPATTPLQQLQAIKAVNAKLLDQQTATLQKLEEMRVQAQQLKSFTKRS